MTHNQKLFEYIHAIGPIYSENHCTTDFTGEMDKEKGSVFYKVFVKGGIRFEISKERWKNEWVYSIWIIWPGPYNAKDATDILAALTMLNHGKLPEIKK